MSLFKKFQSGLKKTSVYLNKNILNTFKNNSISEETFEQLEEILLSSDIGIEVTNQLINKIQSAKISDSADLKEIIKILSSEIENILVNREKILIHLIINLLLIVIILLIFGMKLKIMLNFIINIIILIVIYLNTLIHLPLYYLYSLLYN